MNNRTVAIILVIITTFLTSVAQIFYKKGANILSLNFSNIFLNYHLIGGILLYVIGSILLILAFKNNEVSVLYPILATSYIWVAILSKLFFGEQMNFLKWIGIIFIMGGIVIINMKSKITKFVEAV